MVTGASRGIGRAVAEAFAREGADLVLTATSVEHLASTAAACRASGSEVTCLALDLTDRASAERAGDEAVAALGRIDVLVNNAGLLGVRQPLAEHPLDVLEQVMAASVTGALALTQRILPVMPPGAVIINVTSGAAGRPGWGAYGISRLAVDGMTQMLRSELADSEVRCVAINPGPARTAMRAAAYPREDPATVPHPSSLVEPFVAIAAGAETEWRVEASQWTG